MTIKAVHRGFRVVEVPVSLVSRPAGSSSKIRVVQDGMLILNAIVALFRDYKPLTFFGAIALLLTAAAGTSLFLGFSVAAATVAVIACATAATGAILHTVTRHFQELETQLERVLGDRMQQEDDFPAPAAATAQAHRLTGAQAQRNAGGRAVSL